MRTQFFTATGFILIAPLWAALAAPVTQLVVFGDSLSDAGNASIATLGQYPGANYATRSGTGYPFTVGYYTDGPNTSPGTSTTGLWVDQLAARLNVADPAPELSLGGGTNYAVGSAETGTSSLQDMGNQVGLYTTTHSGTASTLYTLWGGANDIFDQKNPTQAADNIKNEIAALSANGARQFLWLNLPLLGETPLGSSMGSSTSIALNAATNAFNAEFAADVAQLQGLGIDVIPVDVNSLFNQIIATPGAYGFNNVTSPGQGTAGPANSYLFWDDEHPTTAGDALIAQLAYNDLTPAAAVPEPLNAGLSFVGLCGILAAYKLRRKNALHS